MNILADILHFLLLLVSAFAGILAIFWLAQLGSRLILYIFA